ncbi:endonuclease III [Candidatus Bathyarchaeota archaeon]|nr:endonuclease III [Candidatus Bathyarchaeota archaeon]MBS7629440.1 endonuclease III [Candidatus Bathyarchaeota archaeon]
MSEGRLVGWEGGRLSEILSILSKTYPDAKVALNFTNPLEILIATMLSAQCTDERVNKVTEALFKKYRSPEDYAKSSLKELEKDIRPTGFYKAKSKNIRDACRIIVEKFNSQVPKTMAELTSLPGVGRKTANIVLSNAYGIIEGIAVDTHVARVSRRLGLTESNDPNKIEQDLMSKVPKSLWFPFTYQLIEHGRRVCNARKPLCSQCNLNKLCPSASIYGKGSQD